MTLNKLSYLNHHACKYSFLDIGCCEACEYISKRLDLNALQVCFAGKEGWKGTRNSKSKVS